MRAIGEQVNSSPENLWQMKSFPTKLYSFFKFGNGNGVYSIHVSLLYRVVLIVYTGNEDTAARQKIELPLQSPDSKGVPCFGYVFIFTG